MIAYEFHAVDHNVSSAASSAVLYCTVLYCDDDDYDFDYDDYDYYSDCGDSCYN